MGRNKSFDWEMSKVELQKAVNDSEILLGDIMLELEVIKDDSSVKGIKFIDSSGE